MVERAFHVAKQVRTDTGIATGAVSISFVAVQLARRVDSPLAVSQAIQAVSAVVPGWYVSTGHGVHCCS